MSYLVMKVVTYSFMAMRRDVEAMRIVNELCGHGDDLLITTDGGQEKWRDMSVVEEKNGVNGR